MHCQLRVLNEVKFSVALCSYNGAAFIQEQLESIVSGSVQPSQIVVCDDGSSDTTADIVRAFAANSEVSVELHVNSENLGYVKNFEKAVTLCRHPIIFLSDQDDIWINDKAALVLAEFQNPEVGGVFSDADLAGDDLTPMGMTVFSRLLSKKSQKKLGSGDQDAMLAFLLSRPIVTGATFAFRNALLKNVIPFPDSRYFIHDGWLALAIASMSKLTVINRSLIIYRQHALQQVGLPKEGKPSAKSIQYPTLRRDYAHFYIEVSALLLSIPNIRPSARKILADAIAHNNVRVSLDRKLAGRPLAILAEVFKGRYHRFSSGLPSALKDLLAPQKG